MRRLTLVLLLLGGLVAGLAVVEVALRLGLRGRPPKWHHMVSDPLLHHRLRAGATTRVRGVEFRTNSLGLRDREYGPTKPPGVFRILMLGDSFTEGGGLALEESVAKQVESRLNRGRCRERHEVVNAGVGSYSPILEYLLLMHVGLSLEPDLVVLNFDMTDVHDDLVRTALGRLDARGLPVAVPPAPRLEAALLMPPLPMPAALRFLAPVESLANHLVIYQEFRRSPLGRRWFGTRRIYPERLERLGLVGDVRYDILAITRDGNFPGMREAWALTERYLAGITTLARERGVPFVLVVYPHAHQVSATASPGGRRRFGIRPGLYTSERPFAILEDVGRREGFPVLNLLGLFRERAASDGPLFWEDDIHHTPRGAALFGEGIAAGLSARRLVPCLASEPAAGGRRVGTTAVRAPASPAQPTRGGGLGGGRRGPLRRSEQARPDRGKPVE